MNYLQLVELINSLKTSYGLTDTGDNLLMSLMRNVMNEDISLSHRRLMMINSYSGLTNRSFYDSKRVVDAYLEKYPLSGAMESSIVFGAADIFKLRDGGIIEDDVQFVLSVEDVESLDLGILTLAIGWEVSSYKILRNEFDAIIGIEVVVDDEEYVYDWIGSEVRIKK